MNLQPAKHNPMKMLSRSFFFVVLFSLSPVGADTVFDFESQAATSGGGALTLLVLTQGGLTMSLSRQSGVAFDISDNTTSSFPSSFGNRSLNPFSNTSNTAFVANFSAPLSKFSISAGDFNADPDTLTVQAFSGLNGTGTLLATASVSQLASASFPNDFMTTSVSAVGIESIVFIGGSPSFPNSLYYDNLTATTSSTVPDGGTTAGLLGIAISGILWARRKIS